MKTNETMTDFRALCAELANYLQGRKDLECGWGEEDPEQDLLDRTRAALAQPEPQGPMPTDEELMSLYGVETSCYHGFLAEEFRQELDFARAVLARWGRPASKSE